jgi:hypothetical protein
MAELWLGMVISTAICGFIGYAFARKTGRNPVFWTVLGGVLNLFGLVLCSKPSFRRRRSDS